MICEESIADGAVGKKAKPCQSIDERDLGLMDVIKLEKCITQDNQ